MKKLFVLLSLGLAVAFIQSCQKEEIDTPQDNVAPQLPPAESFIMPFTGFEDADTSGIISETEGEIKMRNSPATFRNWFYAASNLVVWNVLVVVGSAVPVAAFGEAFNHSPEHIGGGVYEWSYDYPVGNDIYTARLQGQFVGDGDVEWVMRISRGGGFSDVIWYSGIVANDRSSATWTLNHKPENPETFIRIDYQKDLSTDDFSIRYTNIIPNNADNGHYIEYRTEENAPFNRAYDVFRGNDDFLEIQWNEPSSEGRVKSPAFFEDNDWHCWDADKMDVDC